MPRRLHRCYGCGYLHFITTSCYQRAPLLNSKSNRDLFLCVLEQVRRRYQFVVVGYVVMPEHVHLLIRGVRDDGRTLTLDRDYVRRGIRELSEELIERELGPRLEREGW